MREDGPDDRPTGTPGTGPPSARARADLREQLGREVADARLRFREAGLRAEAHRLLGDDRAAAEVLDEQQEVLAGLERRLGRVVSAAVLQRDAEEVLAGVPTLADDPAGSPPRRRLPVLSGVASAVAVLAVATLAVLGVVDSPSRLEVLGAADPADQSTSDAPTDDQPSQRPLPPSPDPAPVEGTAPTLDPTSGATTAATEGDPTPTEDGAASPTAADQDPTEDGTEDGAGPSLDELVSGLGDALRRLGPDDDPDGGLPREGAPTDGTDSLDDVVDDVADELDEDRDLDSSSSPDPDVAGTGDEPADDGFVSDAGAQ